MARNMVATTVRAMTKAERATVVGATRTRAMTVTTVTTVTTVATMRPNGYKENEDGNSKNNKKATFCCCCCFHCVNIKFSTL